jgi:hypothetical protein
MQCACIVTLLQLAIFRYNTSLAGANYHQISFYHQEPVRVPSNIPNRYEMV